jgi:anti-sigma B factor antagonist
MLPPEFGGALSRPALCEINAVYVIHRLSNLFNRLFHENRYCLTGRKRGSIMSLTINVREAANATILELDGRLTLGASGPSLRDTVRGLLDSLRKNIVLDLGGVTYFDSFGLGQLIASNVDATSQGGAIKLLNLNKKTQDLMLLTKLYTVFAIYTDESTALMSFNVAPVHS